MVIYQETRVKLTNIQLTKLKSAAKNNKGKILRLTKNMSRDIKLSKD